MKMIIKDRGKGKTTGLIHILMKNAKVIYGEQVDVYTKDIIYVCMH